ncbi:hypothetical protein [Pseudomonas citronellolis]|uniref:hypothetical protein n=1 Tax=Pseudomonas citronellolis TaxID=53408 RepID=UPI0023E393FD|nr:hypothetical protein [Pseudomonas citronellolis]MDF3934537.1 hypothetical protein [Pseudomonas citronellolis]
MSFDPTAAEHATRAVPAGQGLAGWRIGLILMGAMIALPSFMTGAELAHSLGPGGALLACLGGGLILLLVALPAAYAGARSRLTTYMLIMDAFGSVGGRLVNLLLSLSLLGWFGIIASLFGRAMVVAEPVALSGVPALYWSLLGCLLMLYTNLVGFRGLDGLSLLATPLKLILLGWLCWQALGHAPGPVSTPAYSLRHGMSLVVGGVAIGCILIPDICRFARSPGGALLACGGAFGLGFPLLLALVGLPSLASGERELVAIMLVFGLGLPAMLILLLSAWSTNAYNLYATTLVWSSIAPRLPRWSLAMLAGVVGTLAGTLGLAERFTDYLVLLSVALPPVGGVYLCNYYLGLRWPRRARRWRPAAFVAWAGGVLVATLHDHGAVSLVGVPALDALLIAAALYLALHCGCGRAISQERER